jgi:hypothetical protein
MVTDLGETGNMQGVATCLCTAGLVVAHVSKYACRIVNRPWPGARSCCTWVKCSHLLPASRPPDKADVHTKASVLPTALQAHESAIRDGCPLGILGITVHTDLQDRHSAAQDRFSGSLLENAGPHAAHLVLRL